MSTTKLFLGILGAAATGVVVGMILAPEKGSDLRKKIRKTTDDCMRDFADWIGKGKEIIKDVRDMAVENAGKPEKETTSQL